MSNLIPTVFLFVGLDKVSTEIQGLSSTYCNFQGRSRPWISFIKFKDFQGACEPWENLVLHFSRSLARLATPKTYKLAKYYRRITPKNKTFYLLLLSEAEHHLTSLTQNFSIKMKLHGTIRNDDFLRDTALQCWNNVAKAWFETMSQKRLKCRPV